MLVSVLYGFALGLCEGACVYVHDIFCMTMQTVTTKWYANYLKSHPYTNFEELKQAFCKRYRKVQTDEQAYMALRNIKQGPKKGWRSTTKG